MSDKMREALAEYDKTVKRCPANVMRLGDRPCPTCSATNSEGCRREVWAAIMVVEAAREALAAIPTTGGKSLSAFVEAIHQNAPNGDWIAVKHHPNGDWSVAHHPLSASPTPSTDVGEDEETRLSNIIGTVLYRSALNGTAAEIDRTTDEIIAAIRKEARP